MINLAIQLLAAQLNQHLRHTYDLNEDMVVVSNLLEMDGSVAPNINNRLVAFLANIEKNAVSQRQPTQQDLNSHALHLQHGAPLNFNLYVMLTANFSGNNYAEALKFLSSTINFFRRNPIFNRQNTPEMDSRIERLLLDIENLSIQDLSNLWSSLGGKYMPSILYRVRMITFDSDEITGRLPVVVEPKSSTGNNSEAEMNIGRATAQRKENRSYRPLPAIIQAQVIQRACYFFKNSDCTGKKIYATSKHNFRDYKSYNCSGEREGDDCVDNDGKGHCSCP